MWWWLVACAARNPPAPGFTIDEQIAIRGAEFYGVARVVEVARENCTGAGGTFAHAVVEDTAGGACCPPQTLLYGGHGHQLQVEPGQWIAVAFVAGAHPAVTESLPCTVGSSAATEGRVSLALPADSLESARAMAERMVQQRGLPLTGPL